MWRTTLLWFAVIAAANAFGTSRLGSRIPPLLNDSTKVAITDGALEVPLGPDLPLSNIDIEIQYILDHRIFNPTHLFYGLYHCLWYQWLSPTAVIIDTQHRCETPNFPEIVIYVQPRPGSRLLTSVVTAKVLDQMLGQLANSDLHPGQFHATLTTRESPPVMIGQFWTDYAPNFVQTEVRRPAKLKSTPNISANIEDRSNTTHEVQPSTLSYESIRSRIDFHGESTRFRRILPKWWLVSFYSISKLLFRQTSSDVAYRLNAPLAAVRFNVRYDYRLVAQISARPVPLGRSPLTWEELMDGVATILEQVIVDQRFEAFNADIFKDDWLAATYVLSQHPIERLGLGNVEIE